MDEVGCRMTEQWREKFCFASLFAIAFFFIYMWIVRFFSINGDFSKNPKEMETSNLFLFSLGVVLFAIVLIISCFIIFRKDDIKIEPLFRYSVYVCEILYLFLAYLLEDKYTSIHQTDSYFRHICPMSVFIMIVALMFILVKRSAGCGKFNKFLLYKNVNAVRVLVTIICTILIAYFNWEPNPFADRGGEVYHVHAYVNSIINVNHLEPYSQEVNSIYGHYGLFYFLPTKFFHLFTENKWNAIALSIMLVSVLSFWAFSYVIHKFVNSDIIFILSELSLATWSFSAIKGGNYFQLFPHRVFFIAVVLAWIAYTYEDSRKVCSVIAWILSSLGVLWNTETGLICVLLVLSFEMYRLFIRQAKLIDYFKKVLWAILACAGAYFSIILYNILVGGKVISLRTFIYPLFSKEYRVVDALQLRIDIPISLYFIVTVFFLGGGCFAFWRILLHKDSKRNILYVIIGLLSIAGLGSSMYYINRFCYSNIQIVIPYFVIDIAIVIGCHFDRQTGTDGIKSLQDVFARGALIVLVALTIESVGSLGENLSLAKMNIHDRTQLNDFVNRCWSIIPENTAFIGESADIVCMLTKCENKIYTMDWCDITELGKEKAFDELKENVEVDYLFVEKGLKDDVIDSFEGSVVEREVNYDEKKYSHGKFYLVNLNK